MGVECLYFPTPVVPGIWSGMEEWPSGQWQQTVNLPTIVYVGSNPTSSTTSSLILGATERFFGLRV